MAALMFADGGVSSADGLQRAVCHWSVKVSSPV